MFSGRKINFSPIRGTDLWPNDIRSPMVVRLTVECLPGTDFSISPETHDKLREQLLESKRAQIINFLTKTRQQSDSGVATFNSRRQSSADMDLDYSVNYGQETLTIILRINPQKIVEEEDKDKTCLLVLHEGHKITALSMDGLKTGKFKVLLKRSLKSDWSAVASRNGGSLGTALGNWQPVYTFQLKLAKNHHLVSMAGLRFLSGRIEDINYNSYIANVKTSLFSGDELTRNQDDFKAIQFNGVEGTIYTSMETITVSRSGRIDVGSKKSTVAGYGPEILVKADGGRYLSEAGFGSVFSITPAAFTDTQQTAITNYDGGIFGALSGPGDGDITITGPYYDDDTAYSGLAQHVVTVFSQENKLDKIEIKFVPIDHSYVNFSVSSGHPEDTYSSWSGFGQSASYPYTIADEVDITLGTTGAQFPNLGITLDKMWSNTKTVYGGVISGAQHVVYSPYERKSYTATLPGASVPTLHISNGKYYIQGYRMYGNARWLTDQKFYLNGTTDITAALAAATGVESNYINSIIMDVKISDVEKLK